MKDAQNVRKDAMSIPVMAPDKGRLIVIDSIDGAGKDTAAGALSAWLERQGLKGFDYNLSGPDQPIPDEANFLLVSEPSRWGIGRQIRDSIMKDKAVSARSTAIAYARDREVLYRDTVLPFLRAKPGRLVIQVRGLMSSFVYQTIQAQDEGAKQTVSQLVNELLELPGNQLELSRRPDLAMLLMLSPETARKRLAGRTEKVDGDKFAHPHFQARASMRYRDRGVLDPFERLGTKVVFIDAEGTPDQVAAACTAELDTLLQNTA
jgi:thymidylate kinase